jgi:hypothetical protein
MPAAMRPKARAKCQHDHDRGKGQNCVRGEGREFAGTDQRRNSHDGHEQRQTAKAAAAVVVAMVMKCVAVPVSVLISVVMPVTVPVTVPMMAPSPAMLFGLAFFERKFVAHTDINFTHVIPYVSYGPIGRNESIIMKSSNIKYSHQIIIITT